MNAVIKALKKRQLKENRNTLVCILGDTGSGKSLAGLSLCQAIDPKFNIDRVVFTPRDFMFLIDMDLPPGSALMWDEVGIGFDSREFMSQLNKIISYTLQVIRHRNYFIVFTVPHLGFIDTRGRSLFHVIIAMDSIDRKRNVSNARFWFIKTNPLNGKTFRCRPRVKIEDRVKRLDFVEFEMPKDTLLADYEVEHVRFKTNLITNLQKELMNPKKGRVKI